MTHINVPYTLEEYRRSNMTYSFSNIYKNEDEDVRNLLKLYNTVGNYITDNDEELAIIKQLILEKIKKCI